MKSMSQLSISGAEVSTKKMKNSLQEIISMDNDDDDDDDSSSESSNQDHIVVYKPSKYLKMPRKLLLH